MNKYALIVVITLVLVGIVVFSYVRDNGNKTAVHPQTNAPSAEVQQNRNAVQPPATSSTIVYSDTGFSPDPLRVKAGTEVTFVNNSSQSMWPASGVHPTHREYPTTGGCIGSTFDACRGLLPGESWSFKFDIAGSWNYHNHLSPKDQGTVIVE